ncbi:MAG: type IV toxin-antitoxin system AbiEi family antitoxin domain-containing protein [Bacilli bacterium]|nr:type IV toxin-antitoxin system AbiEi family antitoxin domain-containing protein [Bacilli bacterium]
MNKKQSTLILEYAENHDGYVEVAALREQNIAQTYLSYMEKEGIFRKVAKGLYLKRDHPEDPYYVLHYRYKKLVFSLQTSAFLQGLLPEQKEISGYLPLNYLTQGISGVASRHVGQKEFTLGLSLAVTPRGNLVPCYDVERTLLDALRYPEKWEKEAIAALFKSAYPKADKALLQTYAKAFHCEGELALAVRLLG